MKTLLGLGFFSFFKKIPHSLTAHNFGIFQRTLELKDTLLYAQEWHLHDFNILAHNKLLINCIDEEQNFSKAINHFVHLKKSELHTF